MSIKVGDIVYIRTSDEPAFVLQVGLATEAPFNMGFNAVKHLSGLAANVRVPVLRDGGIVHIIQTFLVEELESQEDNYNRKQGRFMQLVTGAKDAADKTTDKPIGEDRQTDLFN